MRRSRILAAVAAMTVASAAALVPATAAHAVSGLGWSASWSYYLDDTYFFNLTLPGAQVVGHVIDNNGSRFAGVSVVDTAIDGGCAIVSTSSSTGSHPAEVVCDGQPDKTFSFTFSGAQHIALFARHPTSERLVTAFVPSSVNDPELRSTGTGASWSYYTDRDYQFSVQRPGVRLTGFGNRSIVLGTVENTSGREACALATLVNAVDNTSDVGAACGPGDFDTLALSGVSFLTTTACAERPALRCISTAAIPQPF